MYKNFFLYFKYYLKLRYWRITFRFLKCQKTKINSKNRTSKKIRFKLILILRSRLSQQWVVDRTSRVTIYLRGINIKKTKYSNKSRMYSLRIMAFRRSSNNRRLWLGSSYTKMVMEMRKVISCPQIFSHPLIWLISKTLRNKTSKNSSHNRVSTKIK